MLHENGYSSGIIHILYLTYQYLSSIWFYLILFIQVLLFISYTLLIIYLILFVYSQYVHFKENSPRVDDHFKQTNSYSSQINPLIRCFSAQKSIGSWGPVPPCWTAWPWQAWPLGVGLRNGAETNQVWNSQVLSSLKQPKYFILLYFTCIVKNAKVINLLFSVEKMSWKHHWYGISMDLPGCYVTRWYFWKLKRIFDHSLFYGKASSYRSNL